MMAPLLRLAAAGLALTLVPALAHAADEAAPKIIHTPISKARSGQAFEISAQIIDESGLFEPTVYYRAVGQKKFTGVPMSGSGPNQVASLPEAAMHGDVEYFIEAYDVNGNGPGRFASEASPQKISVIALDSPPPMVARDVKPEPKVAAKVEPAKPPEPAKVEPPRTGSHDNDLRDDGKALAKKDEPVKIARADVPKTSGEVTRLAGGGVPGTRIAGGVIGGVGVLALGAGTYFGLQAKSSREAAVNDPEARAASASLSSAKSSAKLANVAFIAGGALVATGVVLLVLPTGSGGSSSGGRDQLEATLLVGPGSLGCLVSF